ncbi:MAG: hypothetical protein V4722_04570 [Bacteroidota bacterium]
MEQKDVAHIYPLIVPAGYYDEKAWDLPHYPFANNAFILTWVHFIGDSAMGYLTRKDFDYFNASNQNWQQQSFENLRLSGYEHEHFFTSYKMDRSNGQLQWLSFMNTDAVGSGRILFSDELSRAFPNGYYVALPDRSCGMVIAKDISEDDLKKITIMIKEMHQKATTPMSGKVHLPQEFELPEQWTRPIDIDCSESLVAEMIEVRNTTANPSLFSKIKNWIQKKL